MKALVCERWFSGKRFIVLLLSDDVCFIENRLCVYILDRNELQICEYEERFNDDPDHPWISVGEIVRELWHPKNNMC